MNPRIFLLLAATFALASCRGNVPRPDAETPAYRAPAVSNDAGSKVDTAPITPQQSSGGGYLAGDGPGANTPADLHRVADAVPRNEPLHRYANRPYTVLGKSYTPLNKVGSYKEQGVASWYGKKFHGQKTSIGEIYDMYAMTAAHTTLPIPSYAKVTNLSNGKSVVVRINDRGPFMHERIIDLSYTAASRLGIIGSGQGRVEVESLNPGEGYTAAPPIYKEPLQISALPPDVAAPSSAKGSVYLQLGAFSSQRGAEEFLSSMRAKLGNSGKRLSLSQNKGLVKVRIGPYASAETARATALKMEGQLGFKPVVSFY